MQRKLWIAVLALGLVVSTGSAVGASTSIADGLDVGEEAAGAAEDVPTSDEDADSPCYIHIHYVDTKLGILLFPHPHCEVPTDGDPPCEIHEHYMQTPDGGTLRYPHLHCDL